VVVLEAFYGHVSRREYGAAYGLLSSVRKRGYSPEQFQAEWRTLEHVSVARATWDRRLDAVGGLRQFDIAVCLAVVHTNGARSSMMGTVAMLWDSAAWQVGPSSVAPVASC